jgi:ribose transport system substrate-binding protein
LEGIQLKKVKTIMSLMIILCLTTLIACSNNKENTSSNGVSNKPGETAQKKFKIALSNSFMGNDWRQQMERVAETVAKQSPYQELIDFKIVNTENTPTAQAASIDALVQQKYDAIIIDASSPTAINDSIDRAVKAGVVIVTFDQVVTHPKAYKIDTDFAKGATYLAEYLAKYLKGKGNVVIDRGLAGAPISKVLIDSAYAVFKKYPDIKIVGEFEGNYAAGPTEQGMASVLAAQPKIDAVFSHGELIPIHNAFKAAKRPLVPTSAGSYNGSLVALAQEVGASGVLMNNSSGLSAMALKAALEILQGKVVPLETHLAPEIFATDTSIDIGVPITKIEIGKNAFPDLPPSLMWPAAPEEFHITVDQALGK